MELVLATRNLHKLRELEQMLAPHRLLPLADDTGSFNIGGAVGSDDGLRAFVTITESNFDLLNPPRSWSDLRYGAFRGGGQTFRIGISIVTGSRFSSAGAACRRSS